MFIEVYVDGASAGHPGFSGVGIYLKTPHGSESYSLPIGITNNNEAEFMAVIKGMELCISKEITSVSFRTDSELVERAVDQEFTKNKSYMPYLEKIISLKKHFDLFFIKWIPTKQNLHADALAKKAIRMNE
ncbi:ribonuclease HI family protein [Bacillus gobiensis]|uniref:ribonuclease HI family protein n=1 Tax=Bacillus gobiensis TaxID=1441095 RepID=UPI003D1E4297